MKLKIYDYKNPLKKSKPIGEVIIKHKELIKTISLSNYICNGQSLNSNYRTEYELSFLDEYNDLYKYDKIVIKYTIRIGTLFTAFLRPNFYEKIYLKLLFEYYPIQKIKGGIRTVFEIIGFILTAIITWYTSKC